MWICINVKHIIFPLAKHFQAFTPPSPSESRSVCLDTKWRVTGMLLHSSRSYSDQVATLWCKSFVQLPKGEMSQANTDTSSSLHLNFKMTNVKLNWISCLPPQFPYPFQQEEQLPLIQQGQSCCLGWVVWTTQNHLMGLRWVEAEIKPKPTQLGPARLVPPSPSTLLPELFLVSIFSAYSLRGVLHLPTEGAQRVVFLLFPQRCSQGWGATLSLVSLRKSTALNNF